MRSMSNDMLRVEFMHRFQRASSLTWSACSPEGILRFANFGRKTISRNDSCYPP